MMPATAMLVRATVGETASVCVQQLPPMVTSVVNTACQSNGEHRSCAVSTLINKQYLTVKMYYFLLTVLELPILK